MMHQPFAWGVASASYQIEGGVEEGGRTPCVWDEFSHRKGTIQNGDNGDIACDSYHRYEEDLDIIASLGIDHYRFSISWSRLIPDGFGEVNPEGAAYYNALIDGCIARGITPWITIFHWDTPLVLEEAYGGWQSRRIVKDFTHYALTVCRLFSDRVKHYFIFNEPQCFISLGYNKGFFAPGLCLSPEEYAYCWHNMLLAYGSAVKAIRAEMPGLKLGVASTGEYYLPLSDSPEDDAAAREQTFGLNDLTWGFSSSLFLDPICLGTYPAGAGTPLTEALKNPDPDEMRLIHQIPDFIGLNVYHAGLVSMGDKGTPLVHNFPPGYPRTGFKWPYTPKILRYAPRIFHERYGLPLCISENGMSNGDLLFPDGKVHDPARIEFMRQYFDELQLARAEGIPLFGYFHWSILDNFEWANGYNERFGIVYVDYETGSRTIKDSGYWYSDYIKSHI